MLVPIDFSYTTSCRLSIITFAIRFALAYPISYWCFIGTERLSPAVFEILGSTEHIGGHDLDLSGPLDVIGHIGHSIRRGPFPVNGLLIPSLYL